MLERKQPYSGDEWCSGPESEEDEKPLGSSHSEWSSMQGCCPRVAYFYFIFIYFGGGVRAAKAFIKQHPAEELGIPIVQHHLLDI